MGFLYDPCLDEAALCQFRSFIQKWRRALGPADGASLRFILTPFKSLQTPIAIVAWGAVYMSKCFNEADMDAFIDGHYRQAWEDYWPDGPYDALLLDFEANAVSCGAPAMSSAAVSGPMGWQDGNVTALKVLIDEAVAAAVAEAVKSECVVDSANRRRLSDEPCYTESNTGSASLLAPFGVIS